ncbi:hypothetical protein CHS0354_032859 [Potamilus streckersoni]|uniref:Uncharacterized protein n=1 Tax=Potamilus streckersoni TaxID=2493646 RepID=A0AAE0VR89_9BIVA|nr:hypothetical protein CHS0354_032859 [Potamilus streckersoni]
MNMNLKTKPWAPFSIVEGNIVPQTEYISTHNRQRKKKLTIDRVPIMLIPKARIREDGEMLINRSFGVVADDGTQGLYLSAISHILPASHKPTKSALKAIRYSSSLGRSEVDSGFGSMKRSVTFGDLSHSRSSIRTSDDLEIWSEASQSGDEEADIKSKTFAEEDDDDVLSYRLTRLADLANAPQHLDSFGGKEPVLVTRVATSRPKSRNFTRRKRHSRGSVQCEFCGAIVPESDMLRKKVTNSFGTVDCFHDWVLAKLGKRSDLQYLPRHNYVYRGRAPHFCNFVYQVQLHERSLDRPDTARTGDSDHGSERELIEELVAGRRIGQWRKNSNARNSGTEGRPVSPSSTEDSVDDASLLRDNHFINPHSIAGTKSYKDSLSLSTLTIPPDSSTSGSGMDRLKAHNVPPVHIPSQSEIEEADQLSPRQPPPTPETLLVLTDEKSPPAKKKACITKKTKKSSERTRKKMEDEEAENQAPELQEVETPNYQDEDQSAKEEPKFNIVLPELPSPAPKEKTTKHKEKPTKTFISADDFFKPDPSEILNERLRERRAEFDFSGLETANIMEDLKRAPPTRSFQGRLALSQQSCRFELPMDMQLLETMKPEEYIRKHCKITSRRKTLYKQVFLKHKDKTGVILLKDVEKSLKDVLVNTISSEQVNEICDVLQLNNDTKIDQTLFSGIAAFAERVLYPKFVTEETADMQEYQREKIECADFSALDWKFHGVKVNDAMHRLLKMLA